MPLSGTAEHIKGWNSVHLDPNEDSAQHHLGKIENFVLQHFYGTDVEWFEGYPNMYVSELSEMVVHSESPSMVLSVIKFNQLELAKRHGSRLDVRTFYEKNTSVSQTGQWDRFEGKVAFRLLSNVTL
jgi:hypothetical protein